MVLFGVSPDYLQGSQPSSGKVFINIISNRFPALSVCSAQPETVLTKSCCS